VQIAFPNSLVSFFFTLGANTRPLSSALLYVKDVVKRGRDEMKLSIRPVHPSCHGLLTPTGRRKEWSDGPIKLAPLKEEKML
jgi:hypothetical protein